MKIIFLEIHGVLLMPVCEGVSRLLQREIVGFKPSIDALNLIVRETGGELVLIGKDEMIGAKFKEWGIENYHFDRPPITKGKGNGIIKYMAMAGEPDGFVILDSNMKDEYKSILAPHLIICDKERGLTEALAKKAISILNKRD